MLSERRSTSSRATCRDLSIEIDLVYLPMHERPEGFFTRSAGLKVYPEAEGEPGGYGYGKWQDKANRGSPELGS